MRRGLVALGLAATLVGCASKPPAAWLLYSRANYLYGRIEAKGEAVCRDRNALPDVVDFCVSARTVQTEVKALDPVVRAELAKSSPNWDVILRYVDLIVGVAAKAVVP